MFRYVTRLLLPASLGVGLTSSCSQYKPGTESAKINAVSEGKGGMADETVRVVRLKNNPMIRPDLLPGHDGDNINGPSLIRVPEWVRNRLGRYYLYFAHHAGQYIRLAYADDLAGPWKIHLPGALHLKQTPMCQGHIASPDVMIDEERREFRMYFHGPPAGRRGQESFVALSKNGLDFEAQPESLGLFYFRVFRWRDAWYAMAKGGELYRSADGLRDFEKGHNPWSAGSSRGAMANAPGPRHVGLHRIASCLWVYYTNIGDAPERVMRCSVDVEGDWTRWKAGPPQEVLRPEHEWEGAALPVKRSQPGMAKEPENALRDPDIFVDDDHRVYLLYGVAGEQGIAIAEIK